MEQEPMMARMLIRCTHVLSEDIPTAGVRIMSGGKIELVINPEYFFNLSDFEKIGLIWHEMNHLVYDHIRRGRALAYRDEFNVAADEANNQFIPRMFLPKRAILPEYYGHEKLQSMEYYYNKHIARGDAAKYQQKKYEGGLDDEKNTKDLKKQIEKSLKDQKRLQEELKNQADEFEKESKGQDSEEKDQSSQEKNSKLVNDQRKMEVSQESLSDQLSDQNLDDLADQSDEMAKDLKEIGDQLKKAKENLKDSKLSDSNRDMQSKIEDLQKKIKENQDAMESAAQGIKDIQDAAQNRQNGKGQSSGGSPEDGDTPQVMDNHDIWETSDASPEEQHHTLSNAIKQAYEEASSGYGGKATEERWRSLVSKFMQKPSVDWKRQIRGYIGTTLVPETRESRKKVNKKFGYLLPGRAKTFGPKIMIGVDISASVTDANYLNLMKELKGILPLSEEPIEVFFFTTEVLSKKLHLDKHTNAVPPRMGDGGTNFQSAIDYANEKKPDLLIMLTDGEAPSPTRTRYPILWTLVGKKINPKLHGRQILVDLPQVVAKISEEK